MDKEKFFFTLFLVWYFTQYGPPHNVLLFLIKLYNYGNNFFEYCNTILAAKYFKDNKEEDDDEDTIIEEEKKEEKREEPRYEDKYLNEIRKLDKDFKFDEKEKSEEAEKIIELIGKSSDNRVNELNKINDKLAEIELKLTK
jgi:hypothetical protein